jgi:drug/metabolite transporter (DMT)-like permease
MICLQRGFAYLNRLAARDMVGSYIMLAIVLALFASFCFAVSMILINRGVLAIDYFRGLLTNLGINAVFLWLYVSLFVDRIDMWISANLIFVLVGIFVPGVARFFIFRGMERLGASITSCLTNSTPLFATLFAVSFLHERPTVTNLLGTFLIVLGIVSLSWKGVAKTWQTRDLLFPVTAAFLFAARDNMVRLGLLQIDSPIVGAAIAATTSFLTMSAIYLAFEEKKPLGNSPRRGVALFAAAGFMNFLSYVFAYTALSMERVSLMSPLINGSSLFILPLSALFLKDVEKITARIIAATLLVIFGVFLISWEKL